MITNSQNAVVTRKPKMQLSAIAMPSNMSFKASYDASKSSNSNVNHWVNADAKSAVQENNRATRKILVNRARYETYNNCYGLGIVWSVVESVIGTGVRLQFDSDDDGMDEKLSDLWEKHTEGMRMTDKLSLMLLAEIVDGESFPVFQTNPKLKTASNLDMILIPTERVADDLEYENSGEEGKPNNVDGIQYDAYQNIESINVLLTHPSETGQMLSAKDSIEVPDKYICHYYLAKRIGEKRQVPRITPALDLFAQLRRYTSAVLDTAETAANLSAIIHTNSTIEEPANVAAMDTITIPKNAMMTIPEGWGMSQLKAEQPTTTYAEFKNEILLEAVRCILMPRNIAKGDSSEYNYASGRLDKQQWEKSINIHRKRIETIVLDKFIGLWLDELEFIIPKLRSKRKTMKIEKYWDGEYHVDPVKESVADKQNLDNTTTTLKDICARDGKDWRKVIKQAAIEKALLVKLGLKVDDVLAAKEEMNLRKQELKNNKESAKKDEKAA